MIEKVRYGSAARRRYRILGTAEADETDFGAAWDI